MIFPCTKEEELPVEKKLRDKKLSIITTMETLEVTVEGKLEFENRETSQFMSMSII